MRLSGACSNPLQWFRVERAARAKAKLSDQSLQEPRTRSILRPRMGTIRTCVLDVLDQTRGGLRPKEVLLRVEQRLGQGVSYDTVYWALWDAALDPASAVVRRGRGRYRLRRQAEPLACPR
jgi:hypothetical protein